MASKKTGTPEAWLPITFWDLGRALMIFGGTVAILINIGRWWGAMDTQFLGIARLEKQITEVVLPRLDDSTRRLVECERVLHEQQSRIEQLERYDGRDYSGDEAIPYPHRRARH